MPSTLPYWCEMWRSLKTPVYFFKFSRTSNFSCRRCGRFVKYSFHRIQYRWRELFFSWALFIVVVLLLADVYLFYSRLIKKLDKGKIKKKIKKKGHGVCWKYTREEKGGSKFIVVYYSWQDICHPCIFLIGVYLFVSNWYFSPRVVNNKVKRQL